MNPCTHAETEELSSACVRWYAVHTLPRAELIAERHLQRQGKETFFPHIWATRRHARTLETLKVPLFARYGFVALDLKRDRWRAVNGTTGITRLIMSGNLPLAVPRGIIEEIQSRVGKSGAVELDYGLRPGDPVRVIAGPFAEQIGMLVKLGPNARVEILLRLMGSSTRVSMPRSTVAPAL